MLSPEFGIWLGNTRYQFEELASGAALSDASLRLGRPPTKNEQATLRFCHEWLSGQEEFIIHTSGSTGKPKAITLARQQMEISALHTGQALGLERGMRSLVCLPSRFIAGRMMLVRGFVLGLEMVVFEPNSNPIAKLPHDEKLDFAALVPLQLQTALDGPSDRVAILDRMHAILVGGGPVSAALHQKLQKVQSPIYHTYGMTETVTHIALRRLNGPNLSDAFVPLQGVSTGQDERGCLWIESPMTFGERIQTNDRVKRSGDGRFVWLGRVDNVINSGGVKVQPEQVEEAVARSLLELDEQFAQHRYFVGALPDSRLGQIVTLFIEGPELDEKWEIALTERLRQHLDRFSIPRKFLYLSQFSETPTGKIDRLATVAQI